MHSIMLIIELLCSPCQLLIEFSCSIKMISIHFIFFISMILFSTMLMLLLLFKILVKFTDVGVEFLLVILMNNLLLLNLLFNRLYSAMEFNSLVLWFAVSFKVIFNIKLVIINDGTFSIQSDYGCLQSFNFDFLIRDCHLALVKLFLDNVWLVTWSIRDRGGWSRLLWGSKSRFSHGYIFKT